MPCNDGRPPSYDWMRPYDPSIDLSDEREQHRKTAERLDHVTRLLCRLMGRLEDLKGSKMTNGQQAVATSITDDPELQKWWKEHKTWDEERMRMERNVAALAEQMAAQQELNEVEKNIKTIKSLGGVPSQKLTMRLANAMERVEKALANPDRITKAHPRKKASRKK